MRYLCETECNVVGAGVMEDLALFGQEVEWFFTAGDGYEMPCITMMRDLLRVTGVFGFFVEGRRFGEPGGITGMARF